MSGVIILALAAGVGAWQWRAHAAHKPAFRETAVKRGDLFITTTATGTVEPEEVVDVGAQVAGLINVFGKDKNGKPIDYGSVVEEGTVLAKIDDCLYAADVNLAKAQLEQDRAGEVPRAGGFGTDESQADPGGGRLEPGTETGAFRSPGPDRLRFLQGQL